MKDLAVVLLLVVIGVMLIALAAIVVELDKARNQARIVERVIEVIEVPTLEYHTGTELNEEVRLVVEGGGTQDIMDFFNARTSRPHVSAAILEESLNQKVPITSAFALAWGESRYRTQIINRNGGNTSDWGLFQLNDGHRRGWTRDDFFDVRKNTEEGLNYFAYSLYEFEGDLTLSIAGYNKGVENVKRGSPISYHTLLHINNIMEYDKQLEIDLNRFINGWKHER